MPGASLPRGVLSCGPPVRRSCTSCLADIAGTTCLKATDRPASKPPTGSPAPKPSPGIGYSTPFLPPPAPSDSSSPNIVAIVAGAAAGLAALAALGVLILFCRRREQAKEQQHMVMVAPMPPMANGAVCMQMPPPPASYGMPGYGYSSSDAGYSANSSQMTSTQNVAYRL